MPTNAAATGAWTINNLNNARQGRALLQSLMGGGSTTPFSAVRDGVFATAGANGIYPTDLEVTYTSGVTLNVKPGSAYINRSGQGGYAGWLVSAVNVVMDAAPGPGTSRRDIVIMRIYDAAQGDTVPGSGATPCQIEIVPGTAAASPSDPSITGLSGGGVTIALARATITSGGAVTVTDLRKGTAPATGIRYTFGGDSGAGTGYRVGELFDNGFAISRYNGTSWVDIVPVFGNLAAVGRGWKGEASLPGAPITGITSETLCMSKTISGETARKYLVKANFVHYGSNGDQVGARLRWASGGSVTTSGTLFRNIREGYDKDGSRKTMAFEQSVVPNINGNVTVGLFVYRSSGSGSITFDMSSEDQPFLGIMDVGL